MRNQLGLGDKYVVSYIGTIGYAHGLDIVVKAAQILKSEIPDLIFVLIGEGAHKDKMKDIVRDYALNNIVIMDQVQRAEIPKYINMSDVCLVTLRRSELFKTVIPSKMLEFMACAKPLILGVDGQARRILEDANAGIYIEPDNQEELVHAVSTLYKDTKLRTKYGQNGREYVLKYFTRQQKAVEYIDVLNTVAPSTS